MKLAWTLLFTSSVSAFLAPRSNTPAPYVRPDSEFLVPDGYVVRFHPNHNLEDHFRNIGFDVRQYAVTFMEMPMSNAYLFTLSEGNSSSVHEHIRHDPGVLRVDHDEYMDDEHNWERNEDLPPPTPLPHPRGKLARWINGVKKLDYWNQAMITLGVKRDFGGDINARADSYYMDTAGSGVDVYVFDSGIKVEHVNFQTPSRNIATHFKGLKSTDPSPYCGPGVVMDDLLGHGTHVAGIIANKDGGAARHANLINVKVQKCGGSIGLAELAVGDVVWQHLANRKNPPAGWRGSVINMSIGYRTLNFAGLQDALNIAYSNGIPIAAAAGNNKQDWLEIPARFSTTYSVGAIDVDYNRWQGGYRGISGSNYNKKLNIWAPGKDIWSSTINELDPKDVSKFGWASGSSMATPHVAGVMAIFLSYETCWKISAPEVYKRLQWNGISVVTLDDELRRTSCTSLLVQSGLDSGRRSTWGNPYEGVPRDEFKKPPVPAGASPNPQGIQVDNAPVAVNPAPTSDNDEDEVIVEDDGTVPAGQLG